MSALEGRVAQATAAIADSAVLAAELQRALELDAELMELAQFEGQADRQMGVRIGAHLAGSAPSGAWALPPHRFRARGTRHEGEPGAMARAARAHITYREIERVAEYARMYALPGASPSVLAAWVKGLAEQGLVTGPVAETIGADKVDCIEANVGGTEANAFIVDSCAETPNPAKEPVPTGYSLPPARDGDLPTISGVPPELVFTAPAGLCHLEARDPSPDRTRVHLLHQPARGLRGSRRSRAHEVAHLAPRVRSRAPERDRAPATSLRRGPGTQPTTTMTLATGRGLGSGLSRGDYSDRLLAPLGPGFPLAPATPRRFALSRGLPSTAVFATATLPRRGLALGGALLAPPLGRRRFPARRRFS